MENPGQAKSIHDRFVDENTDHGPHFRRRRRDSVAAASHLHRKQHGGKHEGGDVRAEVHGPLGAAVETEEQLRPVGCQCDTQHECSEAHCHEQKCRVAQTTEAHHIEQQYRAKGRRDGDGGNGDRMPQRVQYCCVLPQNAQG